MLFKKVECLVFDLISFLFWVLIEQPQEEEEKVECKVNKFCYLKSRVFSVWFNFFSFLGSYWAATGGKGWMQGKYVLLFKSRVFSISFNFFSF